MKNFTQNRKYCLFKEEKGPSDKWFRAFEARHPELKWAIPQMIDRQRCSQSTQYVIDDFFNKYDKYDTCQLHHIMSYEVYCICS